MVGQRGEFIQEGFKLKKVKLQKILFDDIYREPLDVKRTWLGVGFNHGDYWSWGEVYYEKDMPKDEFYAMFPNGEKNKKLLEYCGVTDEAKEENNEKS